MSRMLVESKRRHQVFVHRHEPGQIIRHARNPNSFRYLIVIRVRYLYSETENALAHPR